MCQTKVCTKCGVEKSLDEFGALSRSKDRLQTNCKDCRKQYRDERMSTESGKKDLQLRHDWYLRNKSITVDRSRQWRHDNPDRYLMSKAKYDGKLCKKLSDSYLDRLARRHNPLLNFRLPQELIDLKRVELMIKRQLKEMQNGK